MSEKVFLRQQLQLLTKAHYDAVQPIIKRLAEIEAVTAPLYVWSARDGLQWFEEGVKEPKAESAWTARPDCACFPGTCREQVDKDGVTVSGKRCKATKPAATATPDEQSRAMFVARLENMQKNGDHWLTIQAVLALLNDCDMLAAR